MDVFQGWFKDGTQGTRDYRSLSALYMLIRVGFVFMVLALHITDIKTDDLMEWIGPGITQISFGVFFFVFKPYKKWWMNSADGICLVVYGCLSLVQNYHYKSIYIFIVVTHFTLSPVGLFVALLFRRFVKILKTKASAE